MKNKYFCLDYNTVRTYTSYHYLKTSCSKGMIILLLKYLSIHHYLISVLQAYHIPNLHSENDFKWSEEII